MTTSTIPFQVYHTVYQNNTVPKAVEYLSGVFVKVERKEDRHGLLAPLYRDLEKNLFLFSHHPQGLVWQVARGRRCRCGSQYFCPGLAEADNNPFERGVQRAFLSR